MFLATPPSNTQSLQMVNRVGAHALLKAEMLHCPQTMDRVMQGLRKCREQARSIL